MDPQLKSALTTIAAIFSGSIATWAVSKGLISANDQANVANAITAVVGALLAIGLAVWKTLDHSQEAIIKQINAADNGVKVVAKTAAGAQVEGPLK